MKIYISGPMTGLPEFNYPEFERVKRLLESVHYKVESPHLNPEPPCKSWEGWMKTAIAQLVRCDAVATLGGWDQSRGAGIEVRIARDLQMPILYWEEWVKSRAR